jgi:hypothetical protein
MKIISLIFVGILANIRSLRNKLSYIIDIVEDFDITFFTETHLDNSISDADISC